MANRMNQQVIGEETGAVILYRVDDLAICMDEVGNLLYADIPEEYAPVGDALFHSDLAPIENLSFELQTEIRNRIENLNQDDLDEIIETDFAFMLED